MFDATYVINLDRSAERWANACAVADLAGLSNVRRLSAVDGDSLADEVLRQLQAAGRLDTDLSGFTAASHLGEIGCGLSHANALRDIVERGWRSALVLEDDIALAGVARDWPLRCAAAWADLPSSWELWYLYRCFDLAHRVRRLTPRTVVPYSPQGAAAYAVSARGAERLLRAITPLSRPVDRTFMELVQAREVEAYAASPLLIDPGHMPSVINRDNPDRAWVENGINRPPEYWPARYLAHLGEAPPSAGLVAAWWRAGAQRLRRLWTSRGADR